MTTVDPTPVLIGCSHGTADEAGRAAIRSILDDVRARRPDLDVREAFVDVQQPDIARVILGIPADVPVVVVPLLLAAGYHVRVDIAAAATAHPRCTVTPPLGPDPRLARLLLERLVSAGAQPHDAVVLASAGSSDPGPGSDAEDLAVALRAMWGDGISLGFGANRTPSVPDAVATARSRGADRVVLASYLLAPGHFYGRLLEAGADLVTAPLAPSQVLADLVLDRFARACASIPSNG
jgi:sirohydrochlorin ferrochelatase